MASGSYQRRISRRNECEPRKQQQRRKLRPRLERRSPHGPLRETKRTTSTRLSPLPRRTRNQPQRPTHDRRVPNQHHPSTERLRHLHLPPPPPTSSQHAQSSPRADHRAGETRRDAVRASDSSGSSDSELQQQRRDDVRR